MAKEFEVKFTMQRAKLEERFAKDMKSLRETYNSRNDSAGQISSPLEAEPNETFIRITDSAEINEKFRKQSDTINRLKVLLQQALDKLGSVKIEQQMRSNAMSLKAHEDKVFEAS